MKCPACGRAHDATTPPCPQCPRPNDAHLPATGQEHNAHKTAVDPEILGPHEPEGHGPQDIFRVFTESQYNQNQYSGQNSGASTHQQASGFRYVSWQSAAGGSGLAGGLARDSCLPGLLTLFLAAFCSVQFGVLAGIGFLVFTLIGSALTFMSNLRLIMQGQKIYPWLGRALVWGGSWLLTGWLSGGL